jgi:hypothetical protein
MKTARSSRTKPVSPGFFFDAPLTESRQTLYNPISLNAHAYYLSNQTHDITRVVLTVRIGRVFHLILMASGR